MSLFSHLWSPVEYQNILSVTLRNEKPDRLTHSLNNAQITGRMKTKLSGRFFKHSTGLTEHVFTTEARDQHL
jgi:hypothetical protein